MAQRLPYTGRDAPEIRPSLQEDLKILRRLEGTIDMLDKHEAEAPQRRRSMNAMTVRLGRALGQAFG